MRITTLVPFTLMLTGCLAPGERDPTRYPWDLRNTAALSPAPHPRIVARGAIAPDPDWQPQPGPVPQSLPPGASFCIMAIEQERQSGINISANSGVMACPAPANPAQPR